MTWAGVRLSSWVAFTLLSSAAAFCFAVAGAVLTIIGPNLLSQITDLISDALSGEIDLAAIGHIGGILLVLCLFLSTVLAKTMSGRIIRLTSRMKQVKKGELISLPSSIIQGKDEIGELTSTYNYMIHAMEDLIEKEYLLGQETKNAELKILQAQINPHFLYNTLDMIQKACCPRSKNPFLPSPPSTASA